MSGVQSFGVTSVIREPKEISSEVQKKKSSVTTRRAYMLNAHLTASFEQEWVLFLIRRKDV